MKTINFKIISNKNENIYQEGYVEVPEDVEEMPEWFYYDQNGFAIPRVFTHHDEIGLTKIGATDEQASDIEEFNRVIMDEIDFINDAILNAEEDENRTYVRNNITIIVNDGAKMELVCETNYDLNDFTFGDMNFYALMSFKFNGKTIEWDEDLLKELADLIDSTYAGEDRYKIIDNQTIEIEIYDGYDNDLEEYVGLSGHNEESRELIEDHLNDAKNIYKQQLTRNIGVYGIAAGIYEEKYGKLNEGDRDKFANNWEQYFEDYDIGELFILSSEYVEKFIKEELNRDDY